MPKAKDECGFEEMELIEGNKKVVWEYIGEGWSGDYNPDDEEDEPLLRFSCYELGSHDTGSFNGSSVEWQSMDDASYCTAMPIDSPKWMLRKALTIIMEEINTNSSYKRALEWLSHFCKEDFYKKK